MNQNDKEAVKMTIVFKISKLSDDDIIAAAFTGSPGALAKKSCQPGKKCRKLKFAGKFLGCPLNTLVESPPKSRRRNFFIQDGHHRHLLPVAIP